MSHVSLVLDLLNDLIIYHLLCTKDDMIHISCEVTGQVSVLKTLTIAATKHCREKTWQNLVERHLVEGTKRTISTTTKELLCFVKSTVYPLNLIDYVVSAPCRKSTQF